MIRLRQVFLWLIERHKTTFTDTDSNTASTSQHRHRIFQKHFLEGATFVNKSELIEHIAKQADISKAAAARALEALIGGVKSTLKKNNSVSLVGFGTFSVTKRAARAGRNPRTGATIKIKAAKVPKFRPGKALKDHLN
jgi:DNA-binding protein HU-beta